MKHSFSLSATNREEAHELGGASWLIPNDFAICRFNCLTPAQIIVKMKLLPVIRSGFTRTIVWLFDSPLIAARMKNRDFAAMSMSYNLTSLMDIYLDFKDGTILIT